MATGLYIGVNSGARIVWNQKAIYSDVTQLSVVDSIGAMGDSLSIPMVFPTSYITVDNDELPLSGQIVRLVIDDVKLFEGVIPTVSNEWGPNHISINSPITVSSYASLLNSKLVVGEYDEGRAGARIKSILTDFTGTFANDLSRINAGVFIPKATYDWQSVATVISQIASSTGYMWHVDFDKRIHFYADLDKAAPITAINADTNMSVGNLVVQSDASGIVNVVILKDFASKNSNKYSHVTGADGNTSFFSLPMPPFSLEDTDVYVSDDSGETWVQKNLVADPLDGSQESIEGAPGLAYLCKHNWGVRFGTSDIPGAGTDGSTTQVKTNYSPEDPERVTVVFDEDSIQEFSRREGTNGRHEMTVSASDFSVEDDGPVLALGNLILSRRAWPVISGSFIIRTQNYGEWAAGETFTIISAKRDIFDVKTWVSSGYVTKNSVRVWITSVKRRFEVTNSGIIEINTVEFSSVPWS